LANRFAVNSARNVLYGIAHEQRRNAARKLHHLDSAPHVTARFRSRFAVFARVAARDIFKILLEQHFETEQHSRALPPVAFPTTSKMPPLQLARRRSHAPRCTLA
jgi:hypothetical protein